MTIAARNIKTYVLNLPRRADRRRKLEQTLPAELSVTFTSDWPCTFDGRWLNRQSLQGNGIGLFPWQLGADDALWRDELAQWAAHPLKQFWCRPLTLGEIGCTMHHLACWENAYASSNEPFALFLEDDVVLGARFVERLLEGLQKLQGQVPFDLLYAGRGPSLLNADLPLMPGFVRPVLSYNTHSYLLTRPGLAKVLDSGLREALIPSDEFLLAMYMDHPRPDVRRWFPPRLAAVAFDPPIVTTDESSDSDTENAAFASW